MRLNILAVTVVILFADFVSGQFSFGNRFQAPSSSFGNAGAQASSNGFQGAGNRRSAPNFNSNGQIGNGGGNTQRNYQMGAGANGQFGSPFSSAGLQQPRGNPQRYYPMASAGANGNFGANVPNGNFYSPFNPSNSAGMSQQPRGNAFNNAQNSQGFPVNRPPSQPFHAAPSNQGPRGSAPSFANQPSQLNRNFDPNHRNNPNGFVVPQLDPFQKPPAGLLSLLQSLTKKPPTNNAAASNPQENLSGFPPANRPPNADPRQNRNQPLFNEAGPILNSNQGKVQNAENGGLPPDPIATSGTELFTEASPTEFKVSVPDGFLQDLLSGFGFGGMDKSFAKGAVTEQTISQTTTETPKVPRRNKHSRSRSKRRRKKHPLRKGISLDHATTISEWAPPFPDFQFSSNTDSSEKDYFENPVYSEDISGTEISQATQSETTAGDDLTMTTDSTDSNGPSNEQATTFVTKPDVSKTNSNTNDDTANTNLSETANGEGTSITEISQVSQFEIAPGDDLTIVTDSADATEPSNEQATTFVTESDVLIVNSNTKDNADNTNLAETANDKDSLLTEISRVSKLDTTSSDDITGANDSTVVTEATNEADLWEHTDELETPMSVIKSDVSAKENIDNADITLVKPVNDKDTSMIEQSEASQSKIATDEDLADSFDSIEFSYEEATTIYIIKPDDSTTNENRTVITNDQNRRKKSKRKRRKNRRKHKSNEANNSHILSLTQTVSDFFETEETAEQSTDNNPNINSFTGETTTVEMHSAVTNIFISNPNIMNFSNIEDNTKPITNSAESVDNDEDSPASEFFPSKPTKATVNSENISVLTTIPESKSKKETGEEIIVTFDETLLNSEEEITNKETSDLSMPSTVPKTLVTESFASDATKATESSENVNVLTANSQSKTKEETGKDIVSGDETETKETADLTQLNTDITLKNHDLDSIKGFLDVETTVVINSVESTSHPLAADLETENSKERTTFTTPYNKYSPYEIKSMITSMLRDPSLAPYLAMLCGGLQEPEFIDELLKFPSETKHKTTSSTTSQAITLMGPFDTKYQTTVPVRSVEVQDSGVTEITEGKTITMTTKKESSDNSYPSITIMSTESYSKSEASSTHQNNNSSVIENEESIDLVTSSKSIPDISISSGTSKDVSDFGDKNSATKDISEITESITGTESEIISEDGDETETCGDDEEWWDCIPLLHNTCVNFARALARLDFECKPGCFCMDGLIKTRDGECVEPDYCPDPICEDNEEETDCLNMCNTCEANCGLCNMLTCEPGCDCLDGFKRDVNGTCIHASKCPPCTTPSPYISSAGTSMGSIADNATQISSSTGVSQQPTSDELSQSPFLRESPHGSTPVDVTDGRTSNDVTQGSVSVVASPSPVLTEITQDPTSVGAIQSHFSVDTTPGSTLAESAQISVITDTASPPPIYATSLQSAE